MRGHNDAMAGGETGDVTAREVREIWRDQIRPVPAGLVSPRLSAFSRDFLTSVGLPTIQVQEIVPIHDERLREIIVHGSREYVVVAESDVPGYRFGIDVVTDRVYYLPPNPENTRLFNSNIALFVLFIGVYRHAVLELADTTRESLENAVLGVWRQLQDRDPGAATQDDYWRPNLDEVAAEYE